MARRVFYSFHYDGDYWRASQVRNIGAIEGNPEASPNEWEKVKRSGDDAIKRWIDASLKGRSCCVVLIGAQTASRPWVIYEASHAWNLGKGVVGVHIHVLKDKNKLPSSKGANPLDKVTFTNSKKPLSSVAKTYDPPYADSKQAYQYIADNLASWIDEAVTIREGS